MSDREILSNVVRHKLFPKCVFEVDMNSSSAIEKLQTLVLDYENLLSRIVLRIFARLLTWEEKQNHQLVATMTMPKVAYFVIEQTGTEQFRAVSESHDVEVFSDGLGFFRIYKLIRESCPEPYQPSGSRLGKSLLFLRIRMRIIGILFLSMTKPLGLFIQEPGSQPLRIQGIQHMWGDVNFRWRTAFDSNNRNLPFFD